MEQWRAEWSVEGRGSGESKPSDSGAPAALHAQLLGFNELTRGWSFAFYLVVFPGESRSVLIEGIMFQGLGVTVGDNSGGPEGEGRTVWGRASCCPLSPVFSPPSLWLLGWTQVY